MCLFCLFTRVGVNVYVLLVYQSWGECVCFVGLPELG